MKRAILISILLFSLVLSFSFSSAVCLNNNQLNNHVKYYQDTRNCDVYSPVISPNQFSINKPHYSLQNAPVRYTKVNYYQIPQANEQWTNNAKASKACNWHLSLFRSDCKL